MMYQSLGDTDLQVSKICLGTMTFGEQNTEAEAHEQLNYAIEKGVNFIDTAELYAIPSRAYNQGLTEQYIGTWLKNRADRDQLVIASKIAGPRASLNYIREQQGFSPENIRSALAGSLKRLQTDYLDLYQLHWPERRTNFFGYLEYKHAEKDPWQDNFLEIIQTLQSLQTEGKIRHWGISNETPWGMMHYLHLAKLHGLPKPVSIQNPYSLLNRSFEIGLAEIAIREQTGLLAYSPLAFGMLTGKYHNGSGTKPKHSRLSLYGDEMTRYNGDISYQATTEYLKIAQEHGYSLAQMALAYVNSRRFVTSNIIGATKMEQLEENIASIELDLPKEVQKAIESVHRRYPNPAP
ncbi:MAG: NADP(H)-dependent aldo-keto reductase [Bacteroidota bacterium]